MLRLANITAMPNETPPQRLEEYSPLMLLEDSTAMSEDTVTDDCKGVDIFADGNIFASLDE
jgi:hypothetical protein